MESITRRAMRAPILLAGAVIGICGLVSMFGCTGPAPSWKAVSQTHMERHLRKHGFSYTKAFVNNAGLLEIDATGRQISDISCLQTLPVEVLELAGTRIADLRPLRECRALRRLGLSRAPVEDLTPLQDLDIEYLDVSATRVTELDALRNMKLKHLNIANTRLTDFKMIVTEELRTLNLVDADIRDLAPLRGAKLEEVYFSPHKFSGRDEQIGILQNMKTLRCVNFVSDVSDYWKALKAGQHTERNH